MVGEAAAEAGRRAVEELGPKRRSLTAINEGMTKPVRDEQRQGEKGIYSHKHIHTVACCLSHSHEEHSFYLLVSFPSGGVLPVRRGFSLYWEKLGAAPLPPGLRRVQHIEPPENRIP